MGLFGNKKKSGENLKTLSEKDIQVKLYGHLRSPHHVVQDDSALLPKYATPKFANPKPSAAPAVKPFQSSVAAPAKPSAPGEDLFKAAEASSITSPVSANPTVSSVPKPEKESQVKYSSTSKSYQEKPSKTLPSVAKTPAKPGKNFGLLVVDGLKWVGLRLAGFVGIVIASVIRLISSWDMRKPGVRRATSLLAGVAILALVFWGIHHLNLRREIAMKNAPKQARTVEKKKVKKAVPAPAAEIQPAVAAENPAAVVAAPVKEVSPAKPKSRKSRAETAPEVAAPATAAENASEVSAPQVQSEEPLTGPYFTVQVATFAATEDADKLVARFKAAGFNSFRKAFNRSSGRSYYVVFIGRVSSREEADALLAEFKGNTEISKPFQDAFVRNF